ncbi:hypothetical protein B0H42_001412 [Clostridium saccharobutylicum]|nr:hypothetical protein [Clostridium saccharobutylicum]
MIIILKKLDIILGAILIVVLFLESIRLIIKEYEFLKIWM